MVEELWHNLDMMLTSKRLIEVAKSQGKHVPPSLHYTEKIGYDGAGSMSIYRSPHNPQVEPNIFSKMFTPLSLTSSLTHNILWKNETPNSSKTNRPLAIIAEKESDDLIEFINKTFEPKEDQLRKPGIQFDHYGIMYNVQIEIHRNMKDFKIRQMEYGDIKKSRNDYNTRKGLTSKPLSDGEQHFITITHQYINLTNWILKIM
ncbi:unnamed protein product [Didymodactylos carnosus]|uniref:V(D)J recombination-activating protein 1 RNase H domain-containing protein n=1 Tax=Didymodactylos carnosus TaxID=1234261 RepID=A0A815XUA9_9BILA|nr:unnamed protein product [Didymodactylos carnosus]CAF4423233.1 unnamed protein product [Didymodactylos carnosus]